MNGGVNLNTLFALYSVAPTEYKAMATAGLALSLIIAPATSVACFALGMLHGHAVKEHADQLYQKAFFATCNVVARFQCLADKADKIAHGILYGIVASFALLGGGAWLLAGVVSVGVGCLVRSQLQTMAERTNQQAFPPERYREAYSPESPMWS